MDNEAIYKQVNDLVSCDKEDEALRILSRYKEEDLIRQSLALKARLVLYIKKDSIKSRKLLRKAYFFRRKDDYYFLVLSEIFELENAGYKSFKCIRKSVEIRPDLHSLFIQSRLAIELNLPDKLEYAEQFIKKAKAELLNAKNTSYSLVHVLEEIGYIYYQMQNYSEAKEYYRLGYEKGQRQQEFILNYIKTLIYLNDYRRIVEICNELSDTQLTH